MTKNIFEDTKKVGNLSVTVEEMRVEDFLTEDFLEFLSQKYPDKKIRPSSLEVVLLPKEEEKEEVKEKVVEEAEKGEEEIEEGETNRNIIVNIPSQVNSLKFEHRGERDYQNKRLALIADKERDLDSILGKLGDIE